MLFAMLCCFPICSVRLSGLYVTKVSPPYARLLLCVILCTHLNEMTTHKSSGGGYTD